MSIHDHLLTRTLMRLTGGRSRVVRARYDAANSSNHLRTAPSIARHIFRDIPPSERRRLLDASADLYDNSPTFCGIVERLVTFVIGSGIWPESASKDKAFKSDADAAFLLCADDCEYRGGVSWPMLQGQTYRGEVRDGDCAHILTMSEDDSRPVVWGVEGRQIGDPLTASFEFFDGVLMDQRGRPLKYRVTSEDWQGKRSFVDVDRDNIAIFMDPLRIGQHRGIPLLSSALNTGRDVHDILNFEKLAVKDGSTKTDIISTESGEADPEDLARTGGDTLNGSDGEDSAKYYRQVFGPEAKYIKIGDKWEAYKNDRPSPAWQGFMQFLAESICLAARMPPSFLLQIKVGGADTRRDTAIAARVIEMTQQRLAKQFLPVRNHFVRGILGDKGLPKDWQAVAWQYPKSPTVDAGREAQQDREDIRARRMTEQEYQGRYGLNWMRVRDQIELELEDNIARAKRISTKAGISVGEALQLMGELPAPGQPAAGSQPQQAVVDPSPGESAMAGEAQSAALNGAQMASMQAIISQVSLRTLAPAAAKKMLQIALPLVPFSQINSMVDDAAAFKPAEPEQPTREPAQ